jgi:hypothetical protein
MAQQIGRRPKRDHLFMTESQWLYKLQVATQGAAPG